MVLILIANTLVESKHGLTNVIVHLERHVVETGLLLASSN